MLRIIQLTLAATASLTIAIGALAQAPAGAPSGTTGLCKDGSYTSTATKKGACHGHKGVQAWYGPTTTNTRTASAEPSSNGSSAAAPTPSEPATSSHSSMAAGGGAGQVWANTSSKVYHCPGDRYYGKTKSGSYMSEADAKAQGYRPDHGKACTQ